jgi:hypothetical protein
MNRQRAAICVALALAVLPAVPAAQQTAADRPARIFPEFVGTWVLDERAGTAVPAGAERTIVITTTPTEITLLKTPAPWGPEVYRVDGTETNVKVGQASPSSETGGRVRMVYRRQVGT